nr:hypothetical protein [Tanacetum cinerariifolium]GFB64197.1 hypothetical protein [Tanacetum cinerariifolium]
MEKMFDVMGCEDAFKTRLVVYKFKGNALAWWKPISKPKERLKREYHSIRQTNTETSTEFMQRFLRLAGFLGAAAGTEEEYAKNFQWGLRRSTLNHLMCMSYTDVAQVANAARNYEILHERDDDDKSGDRHQPTSQQSSYRNHSHNNDRYGSDRRGGGDNHRSNNNRGSSEGYSYSVCTTCGRRHPGECRRAAGTCFKCGQAGHLQKDCKKNTTASTSGQADKKLGASSRVFAITEGHAAKTSVCTTCGRRYLGECRRATGTCFKCEQAGHLQKDCKKNTTAGTSGQADKKPGATGYVFAITEGHAANTS